MAFSLKTGVKRGLASYSGERLEQTEEQRVDELGVAAAEARQLQVPQRLGPELAEARLGPARLVPQQAALERAAPALEPLDDLVPSEGGVGLATRSQTS